MTVAVGQEQLKELSHFFDHLVELIPAKYYHSADDDQPDLRYMKKNAKAAEKKARKMKAKAAKRAKLDPEKAQTALDIQQQGNNAQAGECSSDDEEDDDLESGRNENGARAQQKAIASDANQLPVEALLHPIAAGKSILLPSLSGKGLSSEDLKARLAKRLEMLRGARKIEEKKQRVQKAKEWRTKSLSQTKKVQSTKRKAEEALAKTGGEQRQGRDPDMQLTFGQLVFDDESKRDQHKKQRRLSKAELLQDAEKKADDEQKLAETSQGKEELNKKAWNAALLRARGEKILDDPKLLRKSYKKEEKLKQKRGDAWKHRQQMQKKDQRDRQKRRRDNLSKRSQEKQKNKIERREKKLMRPGFEGRRNTTIN